MQQQGEPGIGYFLYNLSVFKQLVLLHGVMQDEVMKSLPSGTGQANCYAKCFFGLKSLLDWGYFSASSSLLLLAPSSASDFFL